MLWDKLSASVENDYIDFKREWYSKDKLGEVDLVHDILCMSNSLSDSEDRYIVIGVEEDKSNGSKLIHDISKDANCRQSANLIQTLRNYMSVIPNIELIREKVGKGFIDIIKIMPSARELPYVLNKECQAQKSDGKKVTVRKEWIYSRNSDRNTPKDECCTRTELEELFARKRGEHLPILDRFSMYLDDIENWKHPKSEYEIAESETAYYYTLNHKYKIVRSDREFDKTISLSIANTYDELLTDTCLNEAYWNYKNTQNYCYDDCINLFNVELWADNTLIEVFNITGMFIKHFNYDRYYGSYYVPNRMHLIESDITINNSSDIEKLLVWKICKLLFYFNLYDGCNLVTDDASRILEILNYDYLQKPSEYRKRNEDWLYQPIKIK
ncbi:TPA: hypothetical protein CPT90_08400 [Candidatus Gastranaerophilales bacterium HUM_3]|nr:MAG TPA: hypothetical protein CPT90_08400 [Candidatus Gastranaerophilales bacterium HUM_3]DAA86055.1 MAG TPA: hypothetical protein CPT99_07690 [Candidatus Gastranaerophilales bacterium HUM_4]DAA89209.1 MAG TPA: hypothetical protein CPT87_09700 [Candidatus Gastranaerophilales bacterium HUM_5]